MADKYWWEEDEQKEQGEQTKQKQQSGYWWDDGSIANTVGTNVTNRVNTWLKNHSNYISNYQNRYSGRKYSYEDSYVSDSGSWLDTVSKQKSAFDTEADSILAYMDQFSDYLDADWMKAVRDTLTGARGQQSSIVESATKDNEWWGSFGSDADLVGKYGSAEGVYNYFQRADGYDKKYAGMGLNDLNTALNALEDGEEKDWLAYNQTNIAKNTLSQNADWNERSQYKTTYRGGEKFNAFAGMYTDTGYDDITYDYINRDEKARGRMLVNDIATNASFLGLDMSYLKEMTDDEIAIYNYLYDPNDTSAANEYLAMLLSDLNYRQREKTEQFYADYAKEHPVGSSAFSILMSPMKVLSTIGQVADYAADGTVDQNAGFNKFSYIPTAIRDQVSSDIATPQNGVWGEIGSWTYQLGMSMGDFLLNTAVSGGNSAVSLALMGSGAMADTVISAKDRGLSDDQAMILGVVAGAAEVVTEKFSLDALFKGGLEKGAMKYILTNAFTEGTEEVSSSLINTVADVLVSKDKSEWQMAINDYLAKNPNATEQEAFQKVLGDNMLSLGLDFLGGALMGGTMGTGGATINYATNAAPYLQVNKDAVNQYGGFTKELIDEGLASDPNSRSYDLAKYYEKKTAKGKNLSGYEIRSLVEANEAQFAVEDYDTAVKTAKEKLVKLGESKNIDKIAGLVAKRATGQELTASEKSTLVRSQFGAQVAKEMTTPAVETQSGTKSYNATYKSLEDRVGTESRYGVSDSGQATIRKSNEEISLDNVEVVNTEDGQLTVKLADGQEVYAGDIDFADDTQSYVFSAVADIENITPAAATAIIRDLDLSKPVGAQLNGIDEAYTYGYHGYSVADLKAGQYTSNLTNEQMMSAYKLGQSAKKISDDSKVDTYKKMRTAADAIAEKNAAEGKATKKAKNLTITFNKGNGEVVSIEDAGITDAKKSGGVEVAKILHKMGLGTKVEFFESYISESMTVKDRKTGKVKPARVFINDHGVEQIAYSGVYRKADGTIRVDLNAYNGRGLTLNALAHELTHFIQQWSDRKYRVLADFLMKEYEKTDMTMHERVLKEQKRLEDIRGEEVSYDEAYDEVVANAMSKMFDDGSLVEKLAKLKEQDKNLAQKLWEGFKKILAKFIGIYEKEGALFKDAADLVKMKETFEQLQNMFAEALVEASENYQASLTLAESQTLTEAGIGFDESTKSVYSLHFSNAYAEQIQVGKKTFDAEAVAQLVSKATSRSIEDARKWVKSEMAIANIVMQNPEFLDFEADNRYEAIKKNSDYPQGTVDLSNLCPKREEFTTMFDMLQKKYPNKLFTAQDVADMRKILSDNDITVACGACFVEDRRQLIGEIADTFIGMWKEAVDSGKPLQKTNAEGNKIELQVTKALAKQYGLTAGTKIMATDTYIPNQYDLTTYEGFKKLEKNHPTIAMAFNRYNNSRGQQSARLIEGRAEYKRQILGWSDAKVRSVNNNGGLRIFSFSDFEVVHLLDLVQVIIDCAAKGVKIQGYTKIPAFAKLVRDTGIKLNRSLIPEGDYGYHMENGKVVLDYDTTEGINIKDKNFIDESNNPNVGNIVIGINPTQIGAAMLDPFIDYIIPFHSNKAKEILKKLGTGEWVNYKESQHEKDISTGTSSKHNVNIYTEVINKYHPTNKVEFVEAFLKECKRQGKIPRYAEFLNVDENGDYAYREGYHKLLVDFKMFDKDGNILPQGNITPNLEEGFMKDLLNAEIDKKQNYEFPQKVYDAIDKKFGENSLDNSTVGNENKITEKHDRGEVSDNRGIREGASQTAEVSGTDGGRHSDYSGAAQEAKSFGDLSTSTRKRITSVVDDHIANSPNYEEFYDLLCRIANKREDEITPAQLRKAIRQISETIYADAVAMHSVIFENRWAVFGDSVSKLRKDILEALQADSKAGNQYSSQETDADNAPTFYSQMGKVVEGMKQDKFGASSVISMLRGKGVKAEEIRWSGIQAFLDGKKSVTKAELQEFIAGSMLQIEEQVRDKKKPSNLKVKDLPNGAKGLYSDGKLVETFTADEDGYLYPSTAKDKGIWYSNAKEILADYDSSGVNTKWSEYKLDGGKNYREIVFKLPNSTYSNGAMQGHWGLDAKGILAHARLQDFKVNGKKMLFIEEIQSDWHNAGHKEGYITESKEKTTADIRNDSADAFREFSNSDVISSIESRLTRSGYADTVRVIEGLFDGKQFAYDAVVDQIGTLTSKEKAFIENAAKEEAKRQAALETAPEPSKGTVPDAPFRDNYHEFVLKRLLREATEKSYGSIGWTTADIQSERWSEMYAEGYRIEYDQDMPKFLKKYGKQWGAEVGKTTLKNGTEVWSMDITPAMKKSVLEEGQAMYSEHDTDYSNRSLLANAFEGITNGSEEYKLIQKYKGYIAELNSLENKLSEFNRQIREIRFTEGKYDAEKLKKLESEAKKIAEAINKYDQYLLSLEASKPLRKIIEQERKKEAQKTKDHVKEIQQNKKVRAEQTELRHKIRKAVRDLDKLLNRGNKKLNVKEDMKGFASKALELADYLFTDHISNDELIRKGITVRMTPKEAALVKETEDILAKLYDHADSLTDEEFTRLDAKRKANEDKLRDLLTAQRNERLSTPVYQLFDDLVKAYASLKNSSQDAVKAAYDEELEKSLRAFMSDDARVKILENMRVADMTTEELNWLYRAYTMVLNNVRNANKFHVKGMTETIDQKVGRIVSDFGSRKIPDGKVAVVARNLANKIGWDYEKLYYALDRIGSEAFTELIMNLANSENIVMQDVMEATAFRDEIVEKYGFNNWAVNKEIDREFLDNTGKKFKLTLGQMMALYAYSRREGAWDHIEYGGFVFGEAALTNPRPADSYKLSKAQCEAITDLLTKDQKGYVEAMQKYLSETMGEKGNEVSMMLYGIKMFGEKNYFPIHVAGQFKAQAQESQAKAAAGFGSMSNAGFTHAQNPNAKAPFVLEGFNEVWTDHVNEMSRYHGTVPALEDIRRVMNRSSYSDAYMESMSVKAVMENAFGKEAVDYFDNLYREANSGAITDKLQKKSKKLLSLFRKGSVAYSLSVVIQQPSAIKRAYAMIDPKYFGFKGFGALTSGVAKAVTSKWNKAYSDTYNKMLKYAPGVTLAKEIGGFDTHTGTSIREYLLDTNKGFMQKLKTGTVAEKGKAVLDVVDNNAIANLPTVADKIAWMEIWNACERETVAKHKDLTPGSDEFLQTVGDRFTEVIRATQVYDSIFAKSPMLKSKNLAVQYLVSFMNEPNTTANMVEKAVRDAVKGDWKSGVRTAAAVTYSIIFNNVLKSIIYAMRDDDEDETYQEKYIEAVVGNLMSDFNPLSYIPIARDAWSIAQGYDVERADMAIIADALDALDQVIKNGFTDTEEMTEDQLVEFDKKVTEANWKLVESMAAFFGIPVKNIRREINAVLDHARIASANAGLTTDQSRWDTIYDAVIDSIPFMSGNKAKQDKLYDALVSGDTAYVNRLKAGYKTDDSYHSAVRTALRENDPRIREAALAHINGDPSERARIAKQIIEGLGKEYFNDVITAINSEISKLTPDNDSSGTAKVKGYYKAEDFVREAANGDTASLDAIREDILQTAQANGKTEADAQKDFVSDIKSEAKESYIAGALDDSTAKKLLTEYADMDEEEAAEKISYWAFCKANPNADLNESQVKDYQEFAEPANIPMDVFVQYVNGTKGLATVYDEWGDEVKSKREQVLEVIDSLPLTWQQKDALYLAAGYAESTLWDVPW